MSRPFKIDGIDDPANWRQHPQKASVCAVCGSPLTYWYHSNGRDICLRCVVKQSTRSAGALLKKQSTVMEELLAYLSPSREISERLGLLGSLEHISRLMYSAGASERRSVVHAAAMQLGERSEHPLAGLLKLHTMMLLIRESSYCFEDFEDVAAQIISSELCDDLAEFSRLSALVLLYLSGYNERNDRMLRSEQQLTDPWHSSIYILLVRQWRGALLPRIPNAVVIQWFNTCITRYGKTDEILPVPLLEEVIEDHIITAFDHGYTSVELAGIYQRYIKPILPQLQTYVPKITRLPKNLNKGHYLKLLSQILIHPESCRLFFSKMERFIREGLTLMVRTGRTLKIEDLRALGMRASLSKLRSPRDIPKVFPLFKAAETYYYHSRFLESVFFYVPGVCAKVFSIFIPSEQPPLAAELPDPSWRIAKVPDAAAVIMHTIAYIDHVGLSLSKNGSKFTKASLKALGRAAGINEPYPDISRLNTLRSSLLVDMLEGGVFSDASAAGNELVRQIFSLSFSFNNLEYFSTELMLSHLRIIESGSLSRYRMRLERSALRVLLGSMEIGKWVTFDTLFQALSDGALLPRVLDPYHSRVDASFTSLGTGYDAQRNMKYQVALGNYTDAVLIPYLKFLLFLLNTFGVLDLALVDPVNPVYHPLSRGYLSDYDGVHACALTPFGVWLLGKEAPGEIEGFKETGSVHLNEHQLYAVIEGDLPVTEAVLQSMAKKSGNSIYHFTIESFLQDCASTEDIEQKIATFSQVVCEDPPELWKSFFADLQHRGSALTADRTSYITYTVNGCDTELIRVLTEDSFLSEAVIKAEGYRILISRTSYSKVRTRMRSYGYLLPELKKSGGRPKRSR